MRRIGHLLLCSILHRQYRCPRQQSKGARVPTLTHSRAFDLRWGPALAVTLSHVNRHCYAHNRGDKEGLMLPTV